MLKHRLSCSPWNFLVTYPFHTISTIPRWRQVLKKCCLNLRCSISSLPAEVRVNGCAPERALKQPRNNLQVTDGVWASVSVPCRRPRIECMSKCPIVNLGLICPGHNRWRRIWQQRRWVCSHWMHCHLVLCSESCTSELEEARREYFPLLITPDLAPRAKPEGGSGLLLLLREQVDVDDPSQWSQLRPGAGSQSFSLL